jgi:hypothetical protein
MVTRRPSSASVNSTWQLSRERSGSKCESSTSSSFSSLCGARHDVAPFGRHEHVAGRAGTEPAADRRHAVIELAQGFHDLETDLPLDLVLIAIAVGHQNPRHVSPLGPVGQKVRNYCSAAP